MALGKSIKMYLTIFVATTCVYMVLYQYHISREPIPSPEAIKSKSLSAESESGRSASGDRYNLFLWSPLSLMTSHSTSSSSSSSPSSSSSSLATPSSSSPQSSPSSSASSSLPSPSPGDVDRHVNSSTSTTRTTPESIRNNNNNMIDNRNSSNTNATDSSSSSSSSTIVTPTTSTTTVTSTTTTSTTIEASEAPPPLYIITPTYRRPEQLAELTRLGYTLKHVANLLWLVIEDANRTSELVTATLNRIGVPYEYLVAPMPEEYKKTKKAKPRGVSNRNRGLQWLRQNATEGVFYFADDDNTYDLSIFEEMRYTKKVAMWPVGLVTKYGVSSPIIRHGKIEGFYDGWIGGRKYPVDMAGFAVSVRFLHERPDAKMPFKPGYEEDGFLKSLAPLNNTEIELLASNCTEILTWHTQTKKNAPAQPLNMTKYGDTNLVTIDKALVRT